MLALFPLVILASTFAVPQSEKDVQLYPGSVLKTTQKPQLGPEVAGRVTASIEKQYEVAASIDEVVKFYQGKLTGVEASIMTQNAEGKLPVLKKCGRLIDENGEYKTAAEFLWEKPEGKSAMTELQVDIEDIGFSPDSKTCSNKTKIIVSSVTFTAPQENPEAAKVPEAPTATPTKELAKTVSATKGPSEKEVGVPIYPGSRLNVEATEVMKGLGNKGHVYHSDDEVSKVVAFYEGKLGKKALCNIPQNCQIAIEGKLPTATFGMNIQSGEMYGEAAKTVITIYRR